MINTELDNSGFEKGSDKLLAAMNDLTSAVDNLGDNMMSAFRDLTPTLQAIGKNTSQIYAAMASGGDEAIAANEKVAESFSGVSHAAQGVAADIGKEDIPKEISASEKAVSSLSAQVDRLSARAKAGFKSDAEFAKFSAQVDAVKSRISELKKQMGETSGKQLATPDYAWMQETLDKARWARPALRNHPKRTNLLPTISGRQRHRSRTSKGLCNPCARTGRRSSM